MSDPRRHRPGDGCHRPLQVGKAHGRLEQRSIRAAQGLDQLPRQIARIKRYRKPPGKSASGAASGNDHTGTSSPRSMHNTRRQRNCCGRGHRAMENMNHHQRDCVFGKDACLTRPANRASLDNIALAVIFANRRESLAETRRRLDRWEAVATLSANGVRPIPGRRPQPARIPKTTRPRAGDDRGRPRSRKTRHAVKPPDSRRQQN